MRENHHFTDRDLAFMLRALTLARRGLGHVSPNPLVGCIIVDASDTVIGEGAHMQFGSAHAEPIAIADAETKGNSLNGSTVYVTLEPHSHQGKTPPCCDLLIDKRIARCVVAMEDPNPSVHGDGIRRMREAGIEVQVGLLAEEAREQNRFFIKHITTGLPYVTLKLASSLDGRSALANGESRWITSEASRTLVHQMRAEYDAVLIGTGTARLDNPSLTVRLVEGRQPWRVVLDARLELPETLTLFTDEYHAKTLIVTTEESNATHHSKSVRLRDAGIQLIPIPANDTKLDLHVMLTALGAKGITSILAEAGSRLAAALVGQRLFDELQLFVAPILIGGDAQPMIGSLGIQGLSDAIRYRLHSIARVDDSADTQVRIRPY